MRTPTRQPGQAVEYRRLFGIVAGQELLDAQAVLVGGNHTDKEHRRAGEPAGLDIENQELPRVERIRSAARGLAFERAGECVGGDLDSGVDGFEGHPQMPEGDAAGNRLPGRRLSHEAKAVRRSRWTAGWLRRGDGARDRRVLRPSDSMRPF